MNNKLSNLLLQTAEKNINRVIRAFYSGHDIGVWGKLISSLARSSCFQTGPVRQTAVVTVHPVQLVHQLGEYAILTQLLNTIAP